MRTSSYMRALMRDREYRVPVDPDLDAAEAYAAHVANRENLAVGFGESLAAGEIGEETYRAYMGVIERDRAKFGVTVPE
jgi:hypothetical protein